MNAVAEVCADLRGYTGSFEAVHQIMFGPLRFDAHVRAFRAFQFYAEQRRQIARADAAVRAYLAEQGVKV